MSEWQVIARGRKARVTSEYLIGDHDAIEIGSVIAGEIAPCPPGTEIEIAIRVVEPQQPVGDTPCQDRP